MGKWDDWSPGGTGTWPGSGGGDSGNDTTETETTSPGAPTRTAHQQALYNDFVNKTGRAPTSTEMQNLETNNPEPNTTLTTGEAAHTPPPGSDEPITVYKEPNTSNIDGSETYSPPPEKTHAVEQATPTEKKPAWGTTRTDLPTKEDTTRQELESRGVPLFKDEKTNYEEKALLKSLQLGEKIAGKGQGFWGGVRQLGGEMVGGAGLTLYAGAQIVKRPGLYIKTQEAEGTAEKQKGEIKSGLGQMRTDFNEMGTAKKIGYAAAFLLGPKVIKTAIKSPGKAAALKVQHGKPTYKGQVINPDFMKANIKHHAPKLDKGVKTTAVEVKTVGEPTLKVKKPGYVEKVKADTLPGKDKPIKFQMEKTKPATVEELNAPIQATAHETKGTTYKQKTAKAETIYNEKGEPVGLIRDKKVFDKTFDDRVNKFRLKGTVEERGTVPKIKGEKTRRIVEAGEVDLTLLKYNRAKAGGMAEPQALKQKVGGRRNLVIYEVKATSKYKPSILLKPDLGQQQKQDRKRKTLQIQDQGQQQKQKDKIKNLVILDQGQQQKQKNKLRNLQLLDQRQQQKQKQKYRTIIKLIPETKKTTKRPPVEILEKPPKTPRGVPIFDDTPQKKKKKKQPFKMNKNPKVKDVWRLEVKAEKIRTFLFGK